MGGCGCVWLTYGGAVCAVAVPDVFSDVFV